MWWVQTCLAWPQRGDHTHAPPNGVRGLAGKQRQKRETEQQEEEQEQEQEREREQGKGFALSPSSPICRRLLVVSQFIIKRGRRRRPYRRARRSSCAWAP